ncbi:porin family protein [Gaoshiqia sp. Z1-71]|uniref:porin family protein n=1 Tax=Gaoshiqia hydrogeniformans TaxID=3290090 RepID=UPI003BF82A0A
MKKLLVIAMIVCSCLVAGAQNFGLKFGANLSNADFKAEGMTFSPDDRFGIHFGVVSEFPLNEALFISPGLVFSQKGYKIEFEGEKYQDRLNYLDVPVNFLYKVDLTGPKLVLHAGPNFGFGLSGKSEENGVEEDIEFGGGADELKRIDFGLNFGVGAEIMPVQLTLNYTLGLNDISNIDGMTVKNKLLSLSLVYLFGK